MGTRRPPIRHKAPYTMQEASPCEGEASSCFVTGWTWGWSTPAEGAYNRRGRVSTVKFL